MDSPHLSRNMLYYAWKPQPESNLSVKYERNGSLTGLLFFRASNSVYDCVSAVVTVVIVFVSMAHGQVLTGFWWILCRQRGLHMSSVQRGRQKELGRP